MEDEDQDSLKRVEDGEDPGKDQSVHGDSEDPNDPGHPEQREQDDRSLDGVPVARRCGMTIL